MIYRTIGSASRSLSQAMVPSAIFTLIVSIGPCYGRHLTPRSDRSAGWFRDPSALHEVLDLLDTMDQSCLLRLRDTFVERDVRPEIYL